MHRALITFLVIISLSTSVSAQEHHTFEHDQQLCGHTIGGWSDIEIVDDTAWIINDSREQTDLVQVPLDTIHGELTCEQIRVLTDNQGATGFDAEGLTFDGQHWWLSSEGLTPRIMRFNHDFEYLDELDLAPLFSEFSAVDNRAFEALGSFNYFLFTMFEEPPQNHAGLSLRITPIIRFNLSERQYQSFNYELDPLPNALSVLGAVSLVALSNNKLLVLERAYMPGEGNAAMVYHVDLDTTVACGTELCVKKSHWIDVQQFSEITIDNIEGMAFSESGDLVLVSDNNFSRRQTTQLIKIPLNQLPSFPQ